MAQLRHELDKRLNRPAFNPQTALGEPDPRFARGPAGLFEGAGDAIVDVMSTVGIQGQDPMDEFLASDPEAALKGAAVAIPAGVGDMLRLVAEGQNTLGAMVTDKLGLPRVRIEHPGGDPIREAVGLDPKSPQGIAGEVASPVATTIKAGTLFAKAMAMMTGKGGVLEAVVPIFAAARKLNPQEWLKVRSIEARFPDIKPMMKFLTPDELRHMNQARSELLIETWEKLDPSEMASVAIAGQAKRGWYERSGKALRDLFGDEDSVRFAGLLAAMSPQTSVESNLRNALNTWVRWDAAGRPQSSTEIRRIMGQSVEGTGGEASVLQAWQNNTVRALTEDMPATIRLSGPKVDSFMRNLWGDVDEVTNDAWIAKYTGLNPSALGGELNKAATDPGKRGAYLAVSAATRKAADLITKRTGQKWTPAEVQETVWSWAKTITEKRPSNTPITELVNDLTHAEIANTPDFGTMLGETVSTIAGPRTANNEFQQILQRGGYGPQIQQLGRSATARSGASGAATGTPATGTGVQSRHLAAAAERLEGVHRTTERPAAITNLREAVDRSVSGGQSPAFERTARGNRQRNIEATYRLPEQRTKRLNSLGVSTPAVTELRNGSERFLNAVNAAKVSHPYGAQVTAKSAEEYGNMRLFMTEDGKAGFALDGDDIVSLFNHSGSKHQNVSTSMVMLAVEQGGRRLDNYDTFLSKIYKRLGFEEVNRFPWDDGLKPADWDTKAFVDFNGGKPDYLYMEYKPTDIQ